MQPALQRAVSPTMNKLDAMRSTLPLLALLALAAAPPAAAEEAIEPLLSDADAARSHDYCSWRFALGDTEPDLPDFEAMLGESLELPEGSTMEAVILAAAGTRVALATDGKKACRKTFEKGAQKDGQLYDKVLKSVSRRAARPTSDDPEIRRVQELIARLWSEDQAARQAYLGSRTDDEEGADFWARRLAVARATAVDDNSTSQIKKLLETYDWIDRHRFGARFDQHAWILVQHADDDPAFQALVLERMEKHLDNGGVRKEDYAYLFDRVAVNHDRKQRYGTQPDWECNDEGKLELRPLEDPENVDVRRAEMGLGPAEEALAEMTRSVCG